MISTALIDSETHYTLNVLVLMIKIPVLCRWMDFSFLEAMISYRGCMKPETKVSNRQLLKC